MPKKRKTICALVYGDGGAGKSWLGQTTPGPRLVIDAEGGSQYARRLVDGVATKPMRIEWDPTKDEPPRAGIIPAVEATDTEPAVPEHPGDWETCSVIVRDFRDVDRAYAWLAAGKHPFKSVVLDSLTEIQKRCKDAIAGTDAMTTPQWNLLLIKMEHLVRAFRDLRVHATNPLESVLILALPSDKGDKRRPLIQGQLGGSLPGYVDLEGYMFVAIDEAGAEVRQMLIHPRPGFEAKDRTHTLTEKYGAAITEPNIEQMLAVLNEEG